MRKHLIFTLAAFTGLFGFGAPARADVLIRVPFVTVHVGSPGTGVIVNPPLTGPIIVNPPAAPPFVIGQPIDVPPVGSAPRVIVQEPPPRVVVQRAPTLDEFARSFQPAPGKYEVVIQHPVTCEPVKVCFTLPEGCPKKVHVRPREIDFDYGKTDVSIRFIRDGRVRVTE
jgi:hypothetical protein